MDNLQPPPEVPFGQQPSAPPPAPPLAQPVPPAAPPPPYGYGRYVPPPPAAPKRRRWGLITLVVVAVVLLGLFSVGSVLSQLMGGLTPGAGEGSLAGYNLVVEESGKGPKSILMIPVHGLIVPDEGAGPAVISQLRQLRQEGLPADIKVVLLDVDSPGGDVTTCDVIDDEIKKCRKEKNIKVVAFFGDLAASGGYYVSARADRIVARPTSICGSIGVLMPHFDAGKLFNEKLGVKDESIVSGPFKDVPSFFRPMTPEEREYMQNIVDKLHARFVGIVAEGRTAAGVGNMQEADVRKIADGRVFVPEDALKHGLIDEVGHRDRAIAEARRLAGQPEATVLVYRKKVSPLQVLLQGGVDSGPVPREVQTLTKLALHPRMLYLWRP